MKERARKIYRSTKHPHDTLPSSCYNCGSLKRDFYLVVKNSRGQWLYDDVYNDTHPEDTTYEFEICGVCKAAL